MANIPHIEERAESDAATLKQHRWIEHIHGPVATWSILFVSLVLTLMAWAIATHFVEQRAQERFEFEVVEAEKAIRRRMSDYEQVLRGTVGLFAASGRLVTRQEWHAYVSTLKIDHYYPGIQGIGFAYWIPTGGVEQLVTSIRAQGYPDFAVKPEGVRESYASVIYLEPFTGRNLRAFGYDMYSEPTRRAAMQRALETGLPAVSGRLTLMQETTTDVQPGFLMYLPVYHPDMPIHTLEERRRALLGFVYSPFRVNDLMRGILGAGSDALAFEIFDQGELDKAHLLYDSDGVLSVEHPYTDRNFHQVRTLTLPERTWSALFVSQPGFERAMSSSQPTLIAVGGGLIDILLFAIVISFTQQRRRMAQRAYEIATELEQSEVRFRQIFESAPIAMLIINAQGAIHMVNRAIETLFGYERSELIGKSAETLVPDAFASFAAQHTMHSVSVDSQSDSRELSGLHRNGHAIDIEFRLNPISTREGILTLASIVDISKRREIDRLKNEFIANVSHELRTPLTSIRGGLGLITSGACGALPEQVASITHIAARNTERLIRLINDILDMEKIESGKMHYDMSAQDIVQLTNRAAEEASGYAQQFAVTVHVENRNDTEKIALIDADGFTQVLTNLLSNAIKFSPKHERISVVIEEIEDHVRVSVNDHGGGIPSAFKDRIFQKFAQADGSSTRKHAGTGLGLSISHAIVAHFGGRLWFESEPGMGTTFYVDLPLS